MKVGLLGVGNMSTLKRMTEPLRESIERMLPHLAESERQAIAEFARSWVVLAGEIASKEHVATLTESDDRHTLTPRSIINNPIPFHS